MAWRLAGRHGRLLRSSRPAAGRPTDRRPNALVCRHVTGAAGRDGSDGYRDPVRPGGVCLSRDRQRCRPATAGTQQLLDPGRGPDGRRAQPRQQRRADRHRGGCRRRRRQLRWR